MIPAPPGLTARYRHEGPWDGFSKFRVIAFTDDGEPLIVGNEGKHDRRLVPAVTYSNYVGLHDHRNDEYTYQRITTMIPAGGWRIERTDDDGTVWSEPLVGWGLKNGLVVPLETDQEGIVMEAESGGKCRIYHPEAIYPAPADEDVIGESTT